jgi:O-antigen/teichoic acid export membrane protein
VLLSNVVVIFLVQIDRFLIASLVAIGAVTYYSAPYELLNGLWIIPGAVSAVLFPAFSRMHRGDRAKLPELFVRPIKYILILLGPIVLVMAVFSENILLLWLGQSFADSSALVLQLLVVGVLINSLAWTPANLLMGFGRPDVTAKIHLIQLPLYLLMAYPLIKNYGVVGAAVAFCLRVLFEALLLFGASMRSVPQTRQILYDSGIRNVIVCLLLLGCCVFCIALLKGAHLWNVSLVLLSTVGFVAAVWQSGLDKKDKSLIAAFMPLLRQRGLHR